MHSQQTSPPPTSSPTKDEIIHSLKEENVQLRNINGRLQQENEQVRSKVRDRDASLEREAAYKLKHNEEIHNGIALLNAQVATLQQQSETLRKKNRQLENDNLSMKQRMDSQDALLQRLQSKVEALEDEIEQQKINRSAAICSISTKLASVTYC
eukprot:Phypoly_transcript_24368.p1 GENE.Phypoly_transcript_24368~~Phypoly_transcript_24368.p1  ORF type:complete len:154 (+),score=25.35 Phypoly_transcript_24368:32-493(+)